MSHPRRRISLTFLLALPLVGCVPAWSPEPLPLRSDTTSYVLSGRLRVIRTAGDTLTGEGLTFRGDSAWLGTARGGYVPLHRAQIFAIERDRRDLTSGAIILGIAAAVVMVVIIDNGVDDWDWGSPAHP